MPSQDYSAPLPFQVNYCFQLDDRFCVHLAAHRKDHFPISRPLNSQHSTLSVLSASNSILAMSTFVAIGNASPAPIRKLLKQWYLTGMQIGQPGRSCAI